jgi:dTDP-4-amino-4,6-dideoxygalactose transaminase
LILKIPFNRPFLAGQEFHYIQQAIDNGYLSGNGEFTKRCHARLEAKLQCGKALLTHSCTGALEMAAILANIQPGDEIIMPSYTFVSTANAFVLRGGVPVFVDIRPDTLNINESEIEAAITPKTKAIAPVHYAGVGCEMDAILDIAHRYELWVIEDAAQGFGATYQERSLGSMGHLAALSFHETKNVISGEGGALLINDPRLIERAEIIWEKGTNRSQFFRGMVDKYSWVDIGSSYLPSEIIAAFLWSQLEQAEAITRSRLNIWRQYHNGLENLENRGVLRRPIIPANCEHNGHMYYILCPDLATRTALIDFLKLAGIHAVFHYVPLHSAPAGQRFARTSGNLPQTLNLSDRLLRLPMFPSLTTSHVEQVIDAVQKFFAS